MIGLNGLRRVKWTVLRNTSLALGYACRGSIGQGPCTVDVSPPRGMGATISVALRLHAWAEDKGIAATVRSTNRLYSKGQDVFAEFFDREPCRGPVLSRSVQDWIAWRDASPGLPLARASSLMARHFRPNAMLREAIDRACAGNDRFDLSIHFRGTDKHHESGPVEHRQMLDALEGPLSAATRAFLATDDAGFAQEITGNWPGVEFVSFDLGDVPVGTPRHFSRLDPREKALEALVNIYLIASAPLCVRTASYLSAISKLANPAMRTRTINQPRVKEHAFPDDEILALERTGRP